MGGRCPVRDRPDGAGRDGRGPAVAAGPWRERVDHSKAAVVEPGVVARRAVSPSAAIVARSARAERPDRPRRVVAARSVVVLAGRRACPYRALPPRGMDCRPEIRSASDRPARRAGRPSASDRSPASAGLPGSSDPAATRRPNGGRCRAVPRPSARRCCRGPARRSGRWSRPGRECRRCRRPGVASACRTSAATSARTSI